MSQILNNGKIFYFCYGSNLWSKRIQINIKSAQIYGNGLLKNWKFTFQTTDQSKLWSGATASIGQQINENVWGTVWTISPQELERLDKQEIGYKRIEISVCRNGTQEEVNCYTYVQKEFVSDSSLFADNIFQIPSLTYKRVILKGAVEQQLPEEYIQFLQSFPDNGIINTGPPNLDLSEL